MARLSLKLLAAALFTLSLPACITTHSEGFVNFKAVGDVYGTKPQAVDYEEVGTMKTTARGFFWSSCDNVCKNAVTELKDLSKDRGGDSLIDVSFEANDGKSKTPTCATHWSWAYLYILPVFGPWVKSCDIEGVAVTRTDAKATHNQAQKNQAAPGQPVQINMALPQKLWIARQLSRGRPDGEAASIDAA